MKLLAASILLHAVVAIVAVIIYVIAVKIMEGAI